MGKTVTHNQQTRAGRITADILHNLSDISSKGGNFLLNIGPKADGTIPQESIDRLKAVGQWMKTNSEAIHATAASPFARRLPWGRVTRKDSGSGTTLYLHVWDWPADGKLLLPTVRQAPVSGELLANGTKVRSEITAAGLEVTLPGQATDPIISVVKLGFDAPVTVTQEPFVSPAPDGCIHLDPVSADLHGGYSGTIKLRGSGAAARLTNWNDPKWRIEYVVKTPHASSWNVVAEVIAPADVKLKLKADGKESVVAVAATGEGGDFKPVSLGTIKLPAGQQSIHLSGVVEGWKNIDLRNVTLKPAD